MKKTVLPVLLATVWISLSEFVRNTFLLRDFWTEHYRQLGMIFPEQPVNGSVWGIWSLCFAVFVYFVSQRYSLIQTTLLCWFAGFVLMWLVMGNLGVLPFEILPVAIPLSLLEVFLATFIIKKFISVS